MQIIKQFKVYEEDRRKVRTLVLRTNRVYKIKRLFNNPRSRNKRLLVKLDDNHKLITKEQFMDGLGTSFDEDRDNIKVVKVAKCQ